MLKPTLPLADESTVTDYRLVASVVAGLIALTAGVLAPALDIPALGFVAGAAGISSGIAAALIAIQLREAQRVTAGNPPKSVELAVSVSTSLHAESTQPSNLIMTAYGPRPEISDPDLAIDPISGLLSSKYFPPTLERRVALARRQLRPLSLLILRIDSYEHASPDARDHAMAVLGTALRQTLRDSDTICRTEELEAAVLLEDTPEAGAVWATERVRSLLANGPTGEMFTLSAGIASYPSHALNSRELLSRAQRALAWAQSQGRDRVEIARAD